MDIPANIRALYAKANKLRLSVQGLKTQQGYLRQRIEGQERVAAQQVYAIASIHHVVTRIETAIQMILVFIIVFSVTFVIGHFLR
jgi:uncharacterized protein (DUF3084 family)